MGALQDCYEFRDEVVQRIKRTILGPGGTDEDLTDFPLDTYAAGILYPNRDDPIDPSQDDGEGDDDDDEATTFADPPVSLANARYPSSMGITFGVDLGRTQSIRITVEAAMYAPVERDEGSRWERRAVQVEPVILEVDHPVADHRIALPEHLELYARVRSADAQCAVAVTLALVNTRKGTNGKRDADAFYQTAISVRSSDDAPVFVERKASRSLQIDDEDIRSYQLLYRDAKTFAVGHGCAAEWDHEPGATHATSVASTFAPTHPLRLADSNPDIKSSALSLAFLSEATRANVLDELHSLAEQYAQWIADQRGRIPVELDDTLHDVAADHLKACQASLERIRDGIDVLRGDENAWEAFRLANRAMWAQRARTTWIRGGKTTSEPVFGGEHEWRPFQLAFILQCIRGLADATHRDRHVADLLWFPTGGGKTEAYLGLIAFAIFLRRLRNSSASGVTVLMRYTLRLLTIQQFDRAALLIACCEDIRRADARLGPAEISVGLWVGQGGSPNTIDQARHALDQLRNDQKVEEANPVQLRACPWCGAALGPWQYEISTEPRLVVKCRDKACQFSQGLPVVLVDEDVYRQRPTLLIATSDKFATMPWRPDTMALFNRSAPVLPPPALIIQDELHLISGPLGTLAGLYETAVDFLCTDSGVPPKVVASTATIRRASAQTRGLFTREMRQFPPPGLDANDSWFSVEAPADVKGTRMYVGLMAPGVSHATLMIRAYAALLQAAKEISGQDEARDPYWTLVGYFNSLRVLGGARMQVQDDVGDRIQLIAGPVGARSLDSDARIELTSRETSGDIPDHLKRMETSYPDPGALDVILATNMISVGVDIDRLGLMVVMGQPQSTSEYIQATSRVGRQHPGLVATLFNATRSRDRSHYEAFNTYHGALYRQVESTSVTPFSPRSRDRALHAVLVSLVRLTIPALADNKSAGKITQYLREVDLLCDYILERATAVDDRTVQGVKSELERLVAGWLARAAIVPGLRYSDFKDIDKTLLIDAGRASEAQIGVLPTPWSLRDVDQESNLYLVR